MSFNEVCYSDFKKLNFCNNSCGCYRSCCKCVPGPAGPKGDTGPAGPKGDTGATGPKGDPGPFLSSYMEALGVTQTVSNEENFKFVDLDNVGNNVTLDTTGTEFSLNQTGLYLIEWSMNLAEENQTKAHVGLLQNGVTTSFSASSSATGNFASGALINVTEVPYTITLNNRSEESISIEDLVESQSALSIRILRFADGPTV